jgi:hypothetical protein
MAGNYEEVKAPPFRGGEGLGGELDPDHGWCLLGCGCSLARKVGERRGAGKGHAGPAAFAARPVRCRSGAGAAPWPRRIRRR